MKSAAIKPTSKARPVRNAARDYLRAGFAPIPIPKGEKAPKLRGWQKLRLSDDQVDEFFRDTGNIGLLLGEPSGGRIDVDLDYPKHSLLPTPSCRQLI